MAYDACPMHVHSHMHVPQKDLEQQQQPPSKCPDYLLWLPLRHKKTQCEERTVLILAHRCQNETVQCANPKPNMNVPTFAVWVSVPCRLAEHLVLAPHLRSFQGPLNCSACLRCLRTAVEAPCCFPGTRLSHCFLLCLVAHRQLLGSTTAHPTARSGQALLLMCCCC